MSGKSRSLIIEEEVFHQRGNKQQKQVQVKVSAGDSFTGHEQGTDWCPESGQYETTALVKTTNDELICKGKKQDKGQNDISEGEICLGKV